MSSIRTTEERQAEREAQVAASAARQTEWDTYNTLGDDYFLSNFQPTYTKPLNYDGGPGEAMRYNAAGFTDPWLAREWYQYSHDMGDTPSWLQKAWESNNATIDPVGTLGQRIARQGDMPSFSSSEEALKGSYGSLGYGDTGALAYVPKMLGLSADPAMASWMGNNTAAAQAARDDDGFLGLGSALGPLAMMAAMYFMGPAAGALEGAASATAMELAGADAAAGIGALGEAFPEAITADIASATAGNMGYDAAATLGEQAFQTSPLDALKGAYNTAKPYLNAASNVKKVSDIYGALTQDPKAPVVRGGGLQQFAQAQPGVTPSQAFGKNNFNSVRG